MSAGGSYFQHDFPAGWLYGVVYVLYSIYGIKLRKDNIGHDAHLGGALAGMAIANRQKERDVILEKIHTKGINSLTKAEKEKLERYSQQIN